MHRNHSPIQALCLVLFIIYTCNVVPQSLSDHIHNWQNKNHCSEVDRNALLSFKAGLHDPSGRLAAWVGHDCCTWHGIVCDVDMARVVQIRLRNPNPSPNGTTTADYRLRGSISASLLHLKYLNHLDLSFNSFQDIEIPKFLGSFHHLRYLNLSNADFRGPIPRSIGNLSSLQYLDLRSYAYAQERPHNLGWLTTLHSLRYLNLGMIQVTDHQWLGHVNMLPSLRELHLPQCGLSVIPFSLPYLNFSSLSVLDLSNNGFSSSIPQWLSNLTELSYLDLSFNSLQGTIPLAFSNLTSLQTLDISDNYLLRGELSKNLANLCNLLKLDLSVNNFSGPMTELINGLSSCPESKLEMLNLGSNIGVDGQIPDSIGQLRNLKYVGLGGNSLTGPIPDSIGNLSSLEELYIMNTNMSGTPPESMGNLSSLVALDISEIPWEGVMTEGQFLGLKNLKELSISFRTNIPLVINISSHWIPPFKLRYLRIRSCRVGPDFPAWLQNQNELKTLDLRSTGLDDHIPDWISELNLELDELDLGYNQIRGRIPKSIRFSPASTVHLTSNLLEGPLPLFSSNVSLLYLSYNSFTGPIPPDIGDKLPFLTDFDVSYNSLNGSIPLSIGKLGSLTTIVLSNNHLTGTIPDFWETMPLLYLVELSNNTLTGRVPSSLGALSSLKFLMINNNQLHGKIPDRLQNCTEMITLDLGDNRFSGTLPAWIGDKMPSLLILRLRSNRLKGIVPRELCKLASLHIFDLADNQMSGIIPSCFINLNGMKSDLNTERYEGQLQVFAKGRQLLYKNTLFLVNSIDISSNNLSGKIPPGVTELLRLGTLNMSNNHLTGAIPEKIGRLQRIETLDLSRNQLAGRIPASMTDLTALNFLNISYNNLWGRIPRTNQFGTFTDPSIYAGNPGLCGFPLLRKCSDEAPAPDIGGRTGKKRLEPDNLGLFVSAGLGFIVGFWGVCGTLIVKASWRNAYYEFLEDLKDWFVVNWSRPWRTIM